MEKRAKAHLVTQKRIELESSINSQITEFENKYHVELLRRDTDNPKGVSFIVVEDIT